MNRRIIFLLPFLACSALAQDDEAAEVRRYSVEMIIFAYSNDVSSGTEVFVADPAPVEDLLDEDSMQPLESQPSVDAREVDTAPQPYEIVMMDEADFTLDEVYGHLRRLGAYKPLLHFGWTQPTTPDRKDEPRPLSSFVRTPPGLEGDLNLYLSRYLHLAVNLQMDAAPNNTVADNRTGYEQPVRYRITEDRIFRNGELRYFDHPKFGALAKITRVENSVDDSDEYEGELLGD